MIERPVRGGDATLSQITLTIAHFLLRPRNREAEYCDERICLSVCVCVCVCVCVFVRDHIFGTTRPIFTTFFMHVTYGSGSVLFWHLCTSGFMDDVIFPHRPRLLDVAAQLKRSADDAQPWAWL